MPLLSEVLGKFRALHKGLFFFLVQGTVLSDGTKPLQTGGQSLLSPKVSGCK